MSWINMLNAWQWLIMAAIPPLIVMLYFLKLRRQPVIVPSTYLWKRTIEDLHVNSIWQRLRKNLLLLFQLLVLLALILACLRPGFRSQERLGSRSILMIDNSGSMQATDVGGSRLNAAKQRALEMIDRLQAGDVAMVVAFSDRADVRQGFTGDRKKLRAAIESIKPTERITDLNEALRAASGLANPGRTSQIEDMYDIQVAEALPATLYILSDGGFAPPQTDLGNLAAEYIPIGSDSARNVGIVAFTVERNPERAGQVEAFARVQNFGSEASVVSVTLSLDGELIDATQVEIEPFSAAGLNFELSAMESGAFQLTLETPDDFDLDNVAFAGLDPPRQLEVVLVTAGNTALEAALATPQSQALASIRLLDNADLGSPEYIRLAESGTIDLFIYDQCAPDKLPLANTLFLGALPPGESWTAGPTVGPLFVIDSNRSHPMLQYVDMGTVRIVEGQALNLPTGGTELIRTNEGILMAVAPREAFQDAVLAMPLFRPDAAKGTPNTDWPIKRSFPVFVFNSLEFLGGAVSSAGSKNVKPGQNIPLTLANRFDRVVVERPGSPQVDVDRSGQPQVIFTQTDKAGVYRVKPSGSDRVLQLFTVNLFSEAESDIIPRPDITIGAKQIVASGQTQQSTRFEAWRWLLGLALVLLSVEWYLYNRRVAV
jgi:hypothetical protein